MRKDLSCTNREYEYDVLRTLSMIGVIVIHVCAMQWRKLDPTNTDWTILHIYDMLSKFSVPVFFMISGRFMLDPDKNYSVSKMLCKVLHIVIVFASWSAVYTLLNICRTIYGGGKLMENKWIFVEFFTGEYHMWFLYTIAGLYLLTPLLRYITASKEMCCYYLVLFSIFGSLVPFLEKMPKFGRIIGEMNDKLLLDMAVGYSGLYVLGHWLRTEQLSARAEKWLYIGGLLGAIFTVTATWGMSCASGVADESLASYLSPNVILTSAAIYHFFVSRRNKQKYSKLVALLSEASFGCYLVHPLFLWIFEWIGFMPTAGHPIIMVPVLTAITLLLSICLTAVMKTVPVLRSVVS